MPSRGLRDSRGTSSADGELYERRFVRAANGFEVSLGVPPSPSGLMGWPGKTPRPAFFCAALGQDAPESRHVRRGEESRHRPRPRHATEKRRRTPPQDGEAALQICSGAEFAHDGRAVAQHISRRDHSAHRHPGPPATTDASFVPEVRCSLFLGSACVFTRKASGPSAVFLTLPVVHV